MSTPTPIELHATLITVVAGATDTRASTWEELIGPVEVLPIVINPRCNWSVEIRQGSTEQRAVIQKAIELLRDEHPYVIAERSPDA